LDDEQNENFIHAVLHNPPFKDKLYDQDGAYKACMRWIDWKRGHQFIFRTSDFQELMSSDRFFFGKMNKMNIIIVNLIYEKLSENSN
jgi:hypothetical protein